MRDWQTYYSRAIAPSARIQLAEDIGVFGLSIAFGDDARVRRFRSSGFSRQRPVLIQSLVPNRSLPRAPDRATVKVSCSPQRAFKRTQWDRDPPTNRGGSAHSPKPQAEIITRVIPGRVRARRPTPRIK